MKYQIEMKILHVSKSLNSMMKYTYAKKEKKKSFEFWDEIVWLSLIDQKIKKPKKPLQMASVEIIRYHYRYLDGDNLAGSYKPLLDAIVKNKIIVDDGWKNIGMPIFDQVKVPKKDGSWTILKVNEK